MTNPSNQTNPLDYPRYVRGIRPALPGSLGDYVETELEKIQNSVENLAVAADANTKTQIAALQVGTNSIYYQSEAPVGTQDKPLVDGDLWFDVDDSNHPYIYSSGAWVDNTDGQITANAAAIVNEQTVRADADTNLASDITTLTSTVNGNTATIQTVQTAVNGLEAKYGVTLNVNGYVTGFEQNNDGSSGSFIIQADKFALVKPGQAAGSPGTTPFQVVGGITYIDNAMITDLTVGKLAGGTLDTGATPITQDSDWQLGTGHIIFDNGAYQKIQGIGFGSANQFIEWFGPKQASFSACTEANAISYLKTNGSAYFGGSLQAGVLRTTGQTTDQSLSANVRIGPFSSNGAQISVVCSYSYDFESDYNHGTASVGADGSATVLIEASTDTGSSWTNLGTLTVPIHGSVTTDADPGVPDHVSLTGDGSKTINWTPGALGTLELRATLTSRTIPTVTGSGGTNSSTFQDITLSSTEQ